jgi:transposase
VAKEMGVSRNTVAKYLKNPEPKRSMVARKQKCAPVMEMVAPRSEEILSEWRERTTHKQRITGTRVHRQLVEEGYEVGITTVRDYLREKRRQKAEVFVPLVVLSLIPPSSDLEVSQRRVPRPLALNDR